jgi:hypothetical protein
VAVLLSACADGTQSWMPFQSGLYPAESFSGIKAELPADTHIIPPGPDIPPALAKVSGTWSGWACDKRVCDIKAAFEKIDKQGAVIVYAFARGRSGREHERFYAEYKQGEFVATLPSGAVIKYRLRDDGHLDFMIVRKDSTWLAGVLGKTT